MTDNETREIKRCYGNVENQIDEILATVDTIDRNEIRARLKNAALDIKKIGYCLYGWDEEKTKIIQYDDRLKEIFDYVDSRLVSAYDYFINNKTLTTDDSILFYHKCIALSIFKMLLNEKDCVSTYNCMQCGEVIELRQIGSLINRLVTIEGAVEEKEKFLMELGINSENILSELYDAISTLQHFLWDLVPPVRY